jgi:hypothetical protein
MGTENLKLKIMTGGLTMVALLGSCANGNNAGKDTVADNFDAQLVAVQQNENGKWSFMAPKGDMVCRNAFGQQPSPVLNGYFSVMGDDSLYTVYKYGEKPQAIKNLSGLKAVGFMNEDIMPVVRRGERISYVDKDGNVKFTLNPYNGHEITRSPTIVHEGMVWIYTDENRYGYANTEGKVVIAPDYLDVNPFYEGRAVVQDADRNGGAGAYHVIDKTGKTIFSPDSSLTPLFVYHNGLLAAGDKQGGFTFFDRNGKVAYRIDYPIKNVLDYNTKYVIFHNDGGTGVMTFDGKEIIKTGKYRDIQLVGNDKFLASNRDRSVVMKEGGKEMCSFKGRVVYNKSFGIVRIGNEKLQNMGIFDFIKVDSGQRTLIGKDGKETSFQNTGDFGALPIVPIFSDYKRK